MERMGDKARAKARCARPASRSCPGTEVPPSRSPGGARPPTRSAIRCCSRPPPAAAGRACGSSQAPDELEEAFTAAARARRRPRSATARSTSRSALVPARHVEIQVLCDAHGRRPHARRARVLDPAPPPEADRGVAVARAHARDARGDGGGRRARVPARRLRRTRARSSSCSGRTDVPRFIELNCRLQVEHPVTRAVTGDRPRPRAARDRRRRARCRLTGRAPRHGHAIEIRINAEDPARGLRARARASSTRFRPPLGPGVRVDTAIVEGGEISPYYDSLIAKLIVWDADRAGGDRARAARAGGARDRRRADDPRARARRPALARVRRAATTRPATSKRWRHRLPSLSAASMSRRRRPSAAAARRQALFLLYQWDLTGQPLASAVRGRARRRSRASSPRRSPHRRR